MSPQPKTHTLIDHLHEALGDHLACLAEGREQPVYLLEALGDELNAEELSGAVASALSAHRPSDPWWEQRALPLLVVAADHGYQYRGSSTQFWEPLGARLATSFGHEDRRAMSGLYQQVVTEFGAASPAGSPWSRKFCHIAWPITHAILPLDLQLPLAKCLAQLTDSIEERTTPEDVSALLMAVAPGDSGARFWHWLGSPALVRELVVALLEESTESWLEPRLLERIRRDIEDATAAKLQLEVARENQRGSDRGDGERGVRRTQARTARAGQLHVSLDDTTASPSLLVELPALSRDALEAARTAPIRLRLWGISTAMRVERLFSGTPVPLRLSALPAVGDPLLLPEDLENAPTALREELATTVVDLTPPLVFELASGDEENGELWSEWCSGHLGDRPVLVLAAEEPPAEIPGLWKVGDVADQVCIRADPREAGARRWLSDLGVAEQTQLRLDWVGGPHRSNRGGLSFTRGDPLIAIARGAGRVMTSSDEQGVEVAAGDLLEVVAGGGDLQVVTQGLDERTLTRLSVGPESRRAVCSLGLEGRPTVQEFLAGRLAIRVSGVPRLEELALQVMLEEDGTTLAWTIEGLSHLPSAVSLQGWSRGLDEGFREQLEVIDGLTLRAVVGGLVGHSWHLEQETLDFWWSDGPAGPVAHTEDGEVPMQAATGEQPLDFRPQIAPPESTIVSLRVPQSERTVHVGGRCTGPPTGSGGWSGPTRPSLLRRARGEGGEAGLLDVLEAYLAWSVATSTNLVVELRCAKVVSTLEAWAVEITCGARWQALESPALQATSGDGWSALVRVCRERTDLDDSLGFDGYLQISDSGEREALEAFARARLRASLPDLEELLRCPSALVDDQVDALNKAFNGAHEDLREYLQRSAPTACLGRDLDPDVWNSREEWEAGLEVARDALELGSLVEWLWPRGGVDVLVTFDYVAGNTEELAKALSRWSFDHRSALQSESWSPDLVLTALQVWSSPAEVVQRRWTAVARRLLSDRGMSRAIRYAALRKQVALSAAARPTVN